MENHENVAAWAEDMLRRQRETSERLTRLEEHYSIKPVAPAAEPKPEADPQQSDTGLSAEDQAVLDQVLKNMNF